MSANLPWLDFTALLLILFSILLPLIRRRFSSLLLFSILVSLIVNLFSSLLTFSLSWKFLWISWKFVDFSSGGFSRKFVFPTNLVSSFLATLLSILYSIPVLILSLLFSLINSHFCSKQLLLLMLLMILYLFYVFNKRIYIAPAVTANVFIIPYKMIWLIC